jgi:hypothetical protein
VPIFVSSTRLYRSAAKEIVAEAGVEWLTKNRDSGKKEEISRYDQMVKGRNGDLPGHH